MNNETKSVSENAGKVLVLIMDYRKENGFAPSVREIGDKLGGVSTNAVHKWLVELEKKGVIRKTPGVARSIVVV